MDIEIGGSTESTTPRQDLHLLRSGRKRLHSSSDAAAIQGLAITKGSGHNYEIFETAYVPIGFRGVGQSSCETVIRIKRSGIDPSIANETDFDLPNGWNYMQWDPSAKTLKAATRDALSSEKPQF